MPPLTDWENKQQKVNKDRDDHKHDDLIDIPRTQCPKTE